MRILHVIEATLAGVGRHVLDLVGSQIEAGHDVHVAYSPLRMDTIFSGEMAGLEAAEWHRVPMDSAPGTSDFGAVLAVRRIIRRHGPFDIIHGHSSKGGGIARLAARRRDGVRVYTPHAVKLLDPNTGAGGRLAYGSAERLLGNLRTDQLIATSPDEVDVLAGLGIPRDRIELVIYGVRSSDRPRRAEMRHKFGIGDDEICGIFVGRFAPQKDPLLAVEALSRLDWQALANLRIVMIGEGPQQTECQRRLEAAGISDRVVMPGAMTGALAMEAADFLIVSSRYDTGPIVTMEAAALGLPVVTTPVGCTPLIVDDGDTGMIVPPDDPDAMADAISRLARSREILDGFSQAVVRAHKWSSVEEMAGKIERLYRMRLAARSGAGAVACTSS